MISVYLKVAMHQGSVLSPLLFAVVMDVVPSEARSGIHSELLYADDLVLMVPIMEPLGRRVTEWRVSLLHKEQKVNAGKYKVMVGSSDGNCNLWKVTRVQANTVTCTVCKMWIHKRYSGIRGNLSLVVDGFRCNRCDGR